MIAPTERQLQILRVMAAGLHLEPPLVPHTDYSLTLRHSTAGYVKPATVDALLTAGWITEGLQRFELTRDGLAHAECRTFVRAFCEEAVAA